MKKEFYIYCIEDITEFIHPLTIAYFRFKEDAIDFFKMIRGKNKCNMYLIKRIDINNGFKE